MARSLSSSYIDDVLNGGLNDSSVGITRRFAGGKLTSSTVIEANGENVLVTPEAGKAITLYWIALEASEENAAELKAEVKVGSKTPYTWFLGKAGVFMHWEPVVGESNDKLTVKLSAASNKVAVSFTYTEG